MNKMNIDEAREIFDKLYEEADLLGPEYLLTQHALDALTAIILSKEETIWVCLEICFRHGMMAMKKHYDEADLP